MTCKKGGTHTHTHTHTQTHNTHTHTHTTHTHTHTHTHNTHTHTNTQHTHTHTHNTQSHTTHTHTHNTHAHHTHTQEMDKGDGSRRQTRRGRCTTSIISPRSGRGKPPVTDSYPPSPNTPSAAHRDTPLPTPAQRPPLLGLPFADDPPPPPPFPTDL